MADCLNVQTKSEDETRRLGAALGAAVEAGDVILLQGQFGAGKTTLVQGLAQGLGVADRVTSPSFVIACEYEGRVPLYHIDLWRVEEMDATTLEALAEYVGGDGVCVVEWPDAMPTDLVEDAIRIRLTTVGENARLFELDEAPIRIKDVFERGVESRSSGRGGRGAGRRTNPRD